MDEIEITTESNVTNESRVTLYDLEDVTTVEGYKNFKKQYYKQNAEDTRGLSVSEIINYYINKFLSLLFR